MEISDTSMQVKGQLQTNYLWIWFEIQLPYIKNPDSLYKKLMNVSDVIFWCHVANFEEMLTPKEPTQSSLIPMGVVGVTMDSATRARHRTRCPQQREPEWECYTLSTKWCYHSNVFAILLFFVHPHLFPEGLGLPWRDCLGVLHVQANQAFDVSQLQRKPLVGYICMFT